MFLKNTKPYSDNSHWYEFKTRKKRTLQHLNKELLIDCFYFNGYNKNHNGLSRGGREEYVQ